jgi:hypothetical protein
MATGLNWPPPDPSTRVLFDVDELGEPTLVEDDDPNPHLSPSQRWVFGVTEAVERPTGWRWLAAAVCDERIMYPAACGWLAGIVAAALWDESWARIVLTGAVVALSGAAFGAVRQLRATRGRTGAVQRHPGGGSW